LISGIEVPYSGAWFSCASAMLPKQEDHRAAILGTSLPGFTVQNMVPSGHRMSTRNKKRKKLTWDEIEIVLDKIRQKYYDYIIEYMKPLSAGYGFEERYLQALKKRVDMETFLMAEISVIQELTEREEKKRRREMEDADDKKGRIASGKKEDFADRMLKEFAKRLEKYPSLQFHEEASSEMQALCGVMDQFEREHLFDAEKYIRKYNPPVYLRQLQQQIVEISNYTPYGTNKVPKNFSRYTTYLEKRPKIFEEIEMEEKRVLYHAAGLLHYMNGQLDLVQKNDELEQEERKVVEKIANFIHNVLSDFRLKDLNT